MRRIASRAIFGQDVCLFCAFRPEFDAVVRSRKARRTVRGYSSSSSVLSPAGASAARRQDEDDDDDDVPPMLKQRQDLANAFPLPKRDSALPPSAQDQDRSSQRSSAQQENPSGASLPSQRQGSPARPPRQFQFGRSQGTDTSFTNLRNRNDQATQHDEFRFRNSFSVLPNRRPTDRARSSQEQEADRSRIRKITLRDRKSRTAETQDRQTRQSNTHANIEETRDANRPSAPDPSTSGTRTFIPFFDTLKSGTKSPEPDRSLGQQAMQERLPLRRTQQSARSVVFDDLFDEEPTYDRRRNPENHRNHQSIRRSRDDDLSEDVDEDNGPIVADIILPASASTDTNNETIGYHHRRGTREDKRKSRSARWEDEDADQALDSTQSAPRRHEQRSRGIRAQDFDYDLAAAEEALFGREKKSRKQKAKQVEPQRPNVRINEYMTVGQLSRALGVKLEVFIQTLEEEGYEGARYDNILDSQTSSMFAEVYGFEPIVASEPRGVDLVARPPPEDITALPSRPPIVTIMGHVDHGKTTILDYLRKSSVAASEHGGITQHIGAFSVTMPGTHRQITFLDTPGHAAFLEMRRRGANVTDIVVLVVAADDSVKPQTIEAIKHALEAKVQIIVAINKVDKEDADIERVKQDLSRREIIVEDYGGDFQAIPVSGKTGQGMSDLEEAIITLADVQDFRAETDGLAEGTILESKVTAAGRVATVLVRRGTLRTGDFIVAGTTWARVRTLHDDTGALVTEALPGTPVQVDGWRGEDPTAGLEVLQAENEDQAKDVIDFRIEQRDNARTSVDMSAINEARNEEAEARAKVLAWEAEQAWAKKSYNRRPKDNEGWVEPAADGGPKRVHFVVKADVAGSAEAVVEAVSAVGTSEIVANIIHSGTGQITESDIKMLAATEEGAYAISFNQPIDGAIYRLAEAARVQILDQNIIYKVTDVVKEKLAEHLPTLITQKVSGEAEIEQIFDVTVKKNKVKIAGCKVTNGTISRADKIRVLRNGSVVYTGTLHSLKNVKRDVNEMRKGTECGMGFEEWEDFQEGDQVQCFTEHEEKRTLY